MRALVPIILLAGVAHADPDRLAPFATREAAVGCWTVGRGATLVLAPVGKHSLTYRARFADLPRGGPAEMTGDATWVGSAGQFEVLCRPRSEHGSFCRVQPDVATGDLRVLVYAHPYNNPNTGRLVENLVAPRCAKQ